MSYADVNSAVVTGIVPIAVSYRADDPNSKSPSFSTC